MSDTKPCPFGEMVFLKPVILDEYANHTFDEREISRIENLWRQVGAIGYPISHEHVYAH